MTDIAFAARPNAVQVARSLAVPVVDVVVPVYNEQAALANSVRRLHRHLRENFPYPVRITIADNASIDDTPADRRRAGRRTRRGAGGPAGAEGRGRALHQVWSQSDSPVLAYMDVDLSTDLAALAPLVAPLISGHSDLAIGTRLARNARVVRGPKREIISRCYNLILKSTLAAGFSDAQCGFKAIRADVARELLPYVEDTGWFFDTELLVLAERTGLRIHEVPVDWVDDPRQPGRHHRHRDRGPERGGGPVAARVRQRLHPDQYHCRPAGFTPCRGTALAAAPGGAVRHGRRRLHHRLPAAVHGAARSIGAQAANLVALLVTAVANTAANRRFTFGGARRRGRCGISSRA